MKAKINIFETVVLAILVLVIAFLLLAVNKYKKQLGEAKQDIENCQLYATQNDYYKFAFKTFIKNSGQTLDLSTEFNSLTNKKIIDNELFRGNGAVLVCRFAENQCDECVRNAIAEIKKKEIIRDNTLFMCLSDNRRGLKLKIEELQLGEYSVFQTSVFDIPAENNGYPYYFVLDNSLNIYDLFIPDKRLPNVTAEYLKQIEKKYFSGEKESEEGGER